MVIFDCKEFFKKVYLNGLTFYNILKNRAAYQNPVQV